MQLGSWYCNSYSKPSPFYDLTKMAVKQPNCVIQTAFFWYHLLIEFIVNCNYAFMNCKYVLKVIELTVLQLMWWFSVLLLMFDFGTCRNWRNWKILRSKWNLRFDYFHLLIVVKLFLLDSLKTQNSYGYTCYLKYNEVVDSIVHAHESSITKMN